MTKFIIAIFVSCLLFGCSGAESENAKVENSVDALPLQSAAQDTSKKSIPMETKKWVGNTQIKINYHSPAVRGRTIWGGLVAYDAVWVTGAHKATTLEIANDFLVNGKRIPAGKYALFSIPGKEEWIIIINKKWNQHLADDYSESDDLVRIKLRPGLLKENVERLTYKIEQRGKRIADIIISWEKIQISFNIEIV